MPYLPPTKPPLVVELYAHPWAERAQRQAAYGFFLPDQIADLKSRSAKSHLGVRWYEFDILPAEKTFYVQTYGDLLRECDDPSAGSSVITSTSMSRPTGNFRRSSRSGCSKNRRTGGASRSLLTAIWSTSWKTRMPWSIFEARHHWNSLTRVSRPSSLFAIGQAPT
jgi:hypothetical protein